MSNQSDAPFPADTTSETVQVLRRILITGASGAIGGALARRAGTEGVGEGFERETGVLETRQAVRGGAQGEFAERFFDGEGEDGGGG